MTFRSNYSLRILANGKAHVSFFLQTQKNLVCFTANFRYTLVELSLLLFINLRDFAVGDFVGSVPVMKMKDKWACGESENRMKSFTEIKRDKKIDIHLNKYFFQDLNLPTKHNHLSSLLDRKQLPQKWC